MACTTILVGKNVSYDGSTLVARNEDSGAGQFNPKKFVIVNPEDQPRLYKSLLSHVEIALPENPMRYSALPNAVYEEEGYWAACGVNEANVSMTATETITSNERVLSADPLVKYTPAIGKSDQDGYIPEKIGGIGEEDMVTLVLPYIKSAREGVKRLAELLETYGTYEMNGIAFQDENEIWWLETIGGHHWIAKKVPDDHYVIMANQLGIDDFDLEDAFDEQTHHMCSADMREFIEHNHLNLSLNGHFNARFAFGSASDSDHIYNTPRVWVSQRYLNPKSNVWDGGSADFKPESDNLPWSRTPEKKITIEDIKYLLSNHFQGTDYDPYSKHANPLLQGSFRSIGVNRNNVLGLVQIRGYMPEKIKSVKWLAFGSNVFNAIAAFYTNVEKTPNYLANTTNSVTTDNFYWTNRMIAALSDPHFALCHSHIERYQNEVQTKSHEIIKSYDAKFKSSQISQNEAISLCEEANESMSAFLKEKTDELLSKVLYEASCKMKNAFARSDA